MENQQARTVTVPRAAELLGVSRHHLYRLAKNGEIPSIRLGRRVVIPRDVVEKLLSAEPLERRSSQTPASEDH